MRWIQRGVLTAAVLTTAGLMVASCDSGGTEPPPPATTTIRATVMADGAGLSGVTVELYASGGTSSLQSRTTGSTGEAVFTGMDAGTYEVEIEVPAGYVLSGGEDDRKTVMVSDGGEAAVSFTLESDGGSNTVEVHMTSGLRFDPAEVTIEPGTTVRWINDANIFHTITPDGHSAWSRATVSSAGETFSVTFNTEGVFPYYCEPHQSQGMTGTVTVETSG